MDFQADVNMTFNFRMKHSKKGSKVYKMAKSLKKQFEKGKGSLVYGVVSGMAFDGYIVSCV